MVQLDTKTVFITFTSGSLSKLLQSMVLRAMTPLPESKAEFDHLVAAVEEFGAWATTELEKLQAIALQESMASAIDEGLRDPDMRKILGKLIGPNSRKNPGGK